MIKYYVEAYEKISQSFMARLNSMDDYTGVIKEPYRIKLRKEFFYGLFSVMVIKKVHLPSGFNASKELVRGREFKF